MKSILYIGTTLMIGASIYGFVDYKKTNRNEEFKNMYTEKTAPDPASMSAKESFAPVTEPAVEIKTVIPEKAIKEIPMLKKTAKQEPAGHIVKKNTIKKQKKLNAELFSRAPLREYPEINETPKVKKARTAEIKSVN